MHCVQFKQQNSTINQYQQRQKDESDSDYGYEDTDHYNIMYYDNRMIQCQYIRYSITYNLYSKAFLKVILFFRKWRSWTQTAVLISMLQTMYALMFVYVVYAVYI